MKTAIVIGGGIVGLSSALALAQEGFRVKVMEADATRGAASWGNAGHIAVEQVEPLASPESLRSFPGRLFMAGGPLAMPPREIATWLPFAARFMMAARSSRFRAGTAALRPLMTAAMPAWRDLAQKLGDPDLLRETGHFVSWQDKVRADAGKAGWHAADTGSAHVMDALPEEIGRLAMLAPGTKGAVRFEGSGSVADLDDLRRLLEEKLIATGGAIDIARAELSKKQGAVLVNGEPADLVLVAGGVGSGVLLRGLGHKVPIIAERGYHVRASAQNWPADMPPVVYEDCNMIVTRYRSCVQAASFVEFARENAPADPRKWERLERHVAALGLPINGPFRRWMGARPTLPDYLPAIGRSAKADNLVYAFGHQHLGLTLAPITARIVADLATGRESAVPLAPFDLSRF
ncbi:NAD(P)/FAD-dependent oxidoreductase [Novosphingobium sp. 9]|uniref:NAD(P)/FAD-dependent oxidoreductase n=1 Tax=Novosphingobium sp. 9 TaxID=2025349 RepID=UPI0021B6B9DD|nr:FAD-binding oxidoreductase [Novosphingobium sp. 9]